MATFDDLRTRPEIGLTGIGGIAAALFTAVSWKVLSHQTVRKDLALRRMLPRYGRKTKEAAFWFGHLGKDWAVIPAAAALAGTLWKANRLAGAGAIAAAASSGVAASHILDAVLPKRLPPPGRRDPFTPSYPSGHALRSTSLLLTAAYVLSREELVERGTVGGLALALSAALGVDRLIHDRHWTTDVLAGWLAAIALAAFSLAGYEVARARRRAIRELERPAGSTPRIRGRTSNGTH